MNILYNKIDFEKAIEAAGLQYIKDEPMSLHTTFRTGGPADYFILPKTCEELENAIDFTDLYGVKRLVLGFGSNVLILDGGFRGAVICLSKMNEISVSGDKLCAMAGARLSSLTSYALNNGLTGSEFAGGIPGSVGGAVFMNAGAYGGEIKDIILSARVLKEGKILTLSKDELKLSYRSSSVMKDGGTVISAEFLLKRGDVNAAREYLKELNEKRRQKQPLNYFSAGSTFKRPEGYFAGALIEECGLKGYEVNGACVSKKHAGFVVNKGGAASKDILQVIKHVKDTVFKEKGVELEPEVRIIGDEA